MLRYLRTALEIKTVEAFAPDEATARATESLQLGLNASHVLLDDLMAGAQAMTGFNKLASGLITTPIALVDFSLPAGYRRFHLEFSDTLISNEGSNIAAALSVDGGKTFINDTVNSDSYSMGPALLLDSSASFLQSAPFTDRLIDTGNPEAFGSSCPVSWAIDIYPGGVGNDILPYFVVEATANYVAPYFVSLQRSIGVVNPAATIPPPTDRVNYIRVLPWGNGSANPPTSGATITTGSYTLWGIN